MIPTLNLLSPKDQTEIKRSKFLLIIHEMLLLMFIVSVIGSATLLSARLILEQRFREVIIEEVPGTDKVIRINRDIKNFNQRIAALERITASARNQFPILLELTEITPPDAAYNLVNIREDDAIVLKGTAETRDTLLKLKSNLEMSASFKNIRLPLQNLIGNPPLDFTIDAQINREL